jgi:hypothetical protein
MFGIDAKAVPKAGESRKAPELPWKMAVGLGGCAVRIGWWYHPV